MILISTGGERQRTAAAFARELIDDGITGIELSGGAYSESLRAELEHLTGTATFQIHNYFPPHREPFVLNLATLDPGIARRSMDHVMQALDWCVALGATRYSVHAGFLIDPGVGELGKRFASRHVNNREAATDAFVKRVSEIADVAQDLGITLMIENNVLSARNLREFEANPLLMCDAQECRELMERMPNGVKLLVDVAHLKVSANSLGFDPVSMFTLCDQWIAGYHLSDNNGLDDSNEAFEENAWFWPYLRGDADYYSIEVYGITSQKLKQQIDLVRSKLAIKERTNVKFDECQIG